MTVEKPARGRPSKLTADVQKKIVKALQAGNYRAVAARFAGVSYESLITWVGRGRTATSGKFHDFYDAVIAAETKAEMGMVAIITRAAKLDAKHAKWFLSHRHRDRWADNLAQGKIELTGKDGGPLKIEEARSTLASKLEALAAKRARKTEE